MKTRFLFVSKASELYNDVSEQFIIPGVNWLSEIRLEAGSEEAIDKRVAEIEQWRTKICIGAENLTAEASYFPHHFVFVSS
jgi:hypothetical protein